eukprot:207401-Chlamydomonas_euryale.AAC.1
MEEAASSMAGAAVKLTPGSAALMEVAATSWKDVLGDHKAELKVWHGGVGMGVWRPPFGFWQSSVRLPGRCSLWLDRTWLGPEAELKVRCGSTACWAIESPSGF